MDGSPLGPLWLLDSYQRLGAGPEFFKVVELTFRGSEGVDDNVTVVEKHPSGIRRPFAVDRALSFDLEDLFDFLGYGIYLPATLSSAEHEVVCKVADVSDIKQDNVSCLLFRRCFYGPMCKVGCFQYWVLTFGFS